MKMQTIMALVVVELKKLYRDPMTLGVLLLMPVGLTFVFYLALGGVSNDYYGYASEMSHFDYLLPGVMGYAIIYMGMIVALALVEYRKSGLLKRVQATPVSPICLPGQPHYCQHDHCHRPGFDRLVGGSAVGI